MVEDHAGAAFGKGQGSTRISAFFCGISFDIFGNATDNDGARLTQMVALATNGTDVKRVQVTAQHKVGLDLLMQNGTPMGIQLLLDDEDLVLLAVGEGNVADDQLIFDAVGVIFAAFGYLFQELGLCEAEIVEADRATVFGVIVVFVLAAVKHESPYGSQTEGEIGLAVFVRHVQREFLGMQTARIVVTAGKNYGAFAMGDRTCDLIDGAEIVDFSAMIGNVTVQNEKVDILTEISARFDGFFYKIVGVRHEVDVEIRSSHGAELDRKAFFLLAGGEVGLAFDDPLIHQRIFARLVQHRHGNAHVMDIDVGAQNAAGIVVKLLGSHAHLDDGGAVEDRKDLIFVAHRKDRGHIFKMFVSVYHYDSPTIEFF